MYSASVTASQWLRVGAIADLRWMEERAINCMGKICEGEAAGVDIGRKIEGKPLFGPGPFGYFLWEIRVAHEK